MLFQFFRFCGVGFFATALQYFILIVFIELGIVNAVIASAIGYILSAIFNYYLNYYFTFASKQIHQIAATRFATVSSVGLLLNTFLMYIFVSLVNLNYLLAQVIITVIVLIWNFSANRIWTYRVTSSDT